MKPKSDEAAIGEHIDTEVTNYKVIAEWLDLEPEFNGSFRFTFAVPEELNDGEEIVEVTPGIYYICVVCFIGDQHTLTLIRDVAEFKVLSGEIELNPSQGPADTLVKVSGTGSFSVTFNVPDGLDAGIYTVDANDGTNIVRAKFTLKAATTSLPTAEPAPESTPEPSNTSISLSQGSGNVGSKLAVGGIGFQPNAMIIIRYDEATIASATSDANGTFMSDFFTVPASEASGHIITATDGINTNQAVFMMESVSPEIPPLLEPQMSSNINSPAIFDWKEVIDDSLPVTYTFQIATSDDYTTDSIVFEKNNITGSEYILTEEEELALAGREDAYYWRVQAVDAASNTGKWSCGEFYLTSSSDFPKWIIYILSAIGAVIIFGGGYWSATKRASKKQG
jgi:hypothetical protein